MLWNLRIAVIDDEPLQDDIIKSSISSLCSAKGESSLIDTFLTSRSLLDALEEKRYDAYFIDINLLTSDGIDLASLVKEKDPSALIVFISNEEGRVYDSLDAEPLAFIRKSRFLQEIEPVINKMIKTLSSRLGEEYILVKVQGGLVKIDIKSCTYIECHGKKQILHQAKSKTYIEIHSVMETLEKELSPKGFIRTHKGYLVNYRYIAYLANLSVRLVTGEEVPISRDKNTEVKERFLALSKQNSLIF